MGRVSRGIVEATAAVGTYPTGMLSCFSLLLFEASKDRTIVLKWNI